MLREFRASGIWRVPHQSTSKHLNDELSNSQIMFSEASKFRGSETSEKFSSAHFKTPDHRTYELSIRFTSL
jgi:hypothetical protein